MKHEGKCSKRAAGELRGPPPQQQKAAAAAAEQTETLSCCTHSLKFSPTAPGLCAMVQVSAQACALAARSLLHERGPALQQATKVGRGEPW